MIGRTISHYRIKDKLGEGGMGVVYKAEDTKLNRTVALKFLTPKALRKQEQRARFIREAQAAAALDHPAICTVYEIDEVDGRIFIAMAYVDGVELKQHIAGRALKLEEALRIATQVAEGLEAAHARNVVHRDVKSGNIMVTPEGQARVMDFGLARLGHGADVTITTEVVGTPAYMPPEQIHREGVDQRSDVWSWGVVAYEMLSGRLPFLGDVAPALIYSILNEEPEPLSELNPAVPHEIAMIVDKALAKDPEERYQSMTELLEDLRNPGRRDWPSTARVYRARPSIAVLGFTDLSPEEDQEYFCDGIAEEIIDNLTQVDGLRVASRRSSFGFKNRETDVQEIGRKLGVQTLLEGSVRKSDQRLRIRVELVSATEGSQLWSARYDRQLKDVFAIQEEIARKVVDALRMKLSPRARRAISKVSTRDLEAYDFYLRGRQYFYRSRRTGIASALQMFSRATERDPRYARAHAGMADCYSYLFMYFDSRRTNLKLAREHSRRALELDGELAEAHAARGLAVSQSKEYGEAEREFEAAIRLNPKLYEAYYFYGRTCFVQGKLAKTAELFEHAGRVSPGEFQAVSLLGFVYRMLDKPEKSAEAYRFSLERVERHLELNPDDSRAIYLAAQSYLELGDQVKGLEWLQRALTIDPDDPYIIYGAACFYARDGQLDQALHWFEKSVRGGFAHLEWIEQDEDLDPIREHPRFREVIDNLVDPGDEAGSLAG